MTEKSSTSKRWPSLRMWRAWYGMNRGGAFGLGWVRAAWDATKMEWHQRGSR